MSGFRGKSIVTIDIQSGALATHVESCVGWVVGYLLDEVGAVEFLHRYVGVGGELDGGGGAGGHGVPPLHAVLAVGDVVDTLVDDDFGARADYFGVLRYGSVSHYGTGYYGQQLPQCMGFVCHISVFFTGAKILFFFHIDEMFLQNISTGGC